MPIYVYEPTVYSEDERVSECCFFETLQSSSEKPLPICPRCSHPIHRAITTFSIAVASPPKANPRQELEARLRKGLNGLASVEEEEGVGKQWSSFLDASKESASSSGRAARLAAHHICSTFCKH